MDKQTPSHKRDIFPWLEISCSQHLGSFLPILWLQAEIICSTNLPFRDLTTFFPASASDPKRRWANCTSHSLSCDKPHIEPSISHWKQWLPSLTLLQQSSGLLSLQKNIPQLGNVIKDKKPNDELQGRKTGHFCQKELRGPRGHLRQWCVGSFHSRQPPSSSLTVPGLYLKSTFSARSLQVKLQPS